MSFGCLSTIWVSWALPLFTCSRSSGLVGSEADMARDETYHDCTAFQDETILLNTDSETIGNLGFAS